MISNPETIISQCDIRENMIVADLGAGSGAYTFPIAKRVTHGKVYAVEVQKELLIKIKQEAQKLKLTNVEVLWATIDKLGGTKLQDRSIDLALISNVLFQIQDKDIFLREVFRIVKPGGQVLLIDWADPLSAIGPKKESIITKENAIALFAKEKFTVTKELDTGAHHYGLLFSK